MITRAEIAEETENSLSEVEQSMWLALFRDHPGYTLQRYPDVATKLTTVEGVKAKQLLAALRKIEALGADTVRLEGGRDGIDVDPVRDRNALVSYGLSVLYERHISSMPPFFTVGTGRRGRW